LTKPFQAAQAGRPGARDSHGERHRVELALASGVSLRAVARKFGVSRDAAWRHQRNHVTPERRAQLVAGPLKVSELAEKAAQEGMALVDYLGLMRSSLMHGHLAAEAGGRPGAALLAARVLECLRLQGQVTGDLTRTAATTVNNTLILSSPLMSDLQQMLVTRLRPFPDAATAVLACRALAYQEGERARTMENPTTRGPIEDAARWYAALAGKLEAARKQCKALELR
jgi:hypothetical protein